MSEELQYTGIQPRSLEVIETELRVLQEQTQRMVLNYAIEAGRRLEEAKAMVEHGAWGGWVKKMGYSQSTANNLMRIFREYGRSQQSLFGGEAKSQTFGNLTYSKALQLLAISDEEERERFVEEQHVADMSTRELDRALKEREEALRRAEQAEADASAEAEARMKMEADMRLLKETDEARQAEVRSAKQEQEKAEARAQRLQSALSEANASAQKAEEEHARILQELEELRSRPAEPDTVAVEAARKAAIEEMTGKVDKAKEAKKNAEEKRKAAEEALAAAQKELAELKAKEPMVRELTQEEKDELTAGAVERARAEEQERLRSLEKQLATADGDTAAFQVLFEAWQEGYRKILEALARIAGRDPEKAGKLRTAVRAAAERMGSV